MQIFLCFYSNYIGVRVALTTERCLKGLPRSSNQQNNNSNTSQNFLPSSPSSSANSTTLSPTSIHRDPSQSPAPNRQQQNLGDLADFKVFFKFFGKLFFSVFSAGQDFIG